MKKIDIHVHTGKYCCPEASPIKYGDFRPCASPEELTAMYAPLDLKKAVILPIVSPECSFQISNESAYAAVKAYPDTFVWFCCIDPRNGYNSEKVDLSVMLERYKKLGALGVGEITSNIRFDDQRVKNLFFHCQKSGMPVLLHIAPSEYNSYGLIDGLGLPGLEASLKAFPDLTFIGHSQPFWSEMSADVTGAERNAYPQGKVKEGRVAELLARYPNLYCDLSAGSGMNALMRDPDYAYRFIRCFADRLLYGTDICAASNTHQNTFNAWLEESHQNGCIATADFEKLCYKNASELLGIEI